jgi:enoyl-CoA hydratase/carnithine racemase
MERRMLKISNHDTIREIQLDRAPVNALNPELVTRLTQAIREAGRECDAIVLSGRDGLFSAGLDVIELLQLDRGGMTDFWKSYFELLKAVAFSPAPVAAAITGHSPAGGAVVCLMCDYRVMNRGDYRIGLNETRVGLIIPPVLHNAMARLTGPRVAEHMLVSGALIDSEEAFKVGLVDALETGADATVENAVNWCRELLSLPRHSMLGNRAFARAHFEQEFAAYTDAGVASFVDTWFSDETQQVMQALVEQLKNRS